jgi:hypothetical protein
MPSTVASGARFFGRLCWQLSHFMRGLVAYSLACRHFIGGDACYAEDLVENINPSGYFRAVDWRYRGGLFSLAGLTVVYLGGVRRSLDHVRNGKTGCSNSKG